MILKMTKQIERTLTVEATGCYDVFGDDVRETLEDYCGVHEIVFVYSFKCDDEQVVSGSIRLDPETPYDYLDDQLRDSLESKIVEKADKCKMMELYYCFQIQN
jgi:hypothetical protein